MRYGSLISHFRAIGAALGALSVAACDVTQSAMVSIDPAVPYQSPIVKGEPRLLGLPPVCNSSLGSYALPKAHLHVEIGFHNNIPAIEKRFVTTNTNNPNNTPDKTDKSEGKWVEVVRHTDPAFIFCLDHLNSPLSNDTIRVEKTPTELASSKSYHDDLLPTKTQFLGAVLVNATDETVAIARVLIRAAATLITKNPNFPTRFGQSQSAATKFGANLEYDPFDTRESAQINARLTELGYCIIIDGFTVASRADHQRYCNDPLRLQHAASHRAEAYMAQEARPANPMAPGVMYRPRLPYSILIYHKNDPRGRGDWHLQYTQVESLENLSPVLAMQIQRAAFGGRRAAFLFKDGTLTSSCVSKTSEINGAVDIVVEAFKAGADIPASIFRIQLEGINDRKLLMDETRKLVEMRKAIAAGNLQAPLENGDPDFPAAVNLGDDSTPGKNHLSDALLQDFVARQAAGFDDTSPTDIFAQHHLCGSKAP